MRHLIQEDANSIDLKDPGIIQKKKKTIKRKGDDVCWCLCARDIECLNISSDGIYGGWERVPFS